MGGIATPAHRKLPLSRRTVSRSNLREDDSVRNLIPPASSADDIAAFVKEIGPGPFRVRILPAMDLSLVPPGVDVIEFYRDYLARRSQVQSGGIAGLDGGDDCE